MNEMIEKLRAVLTELGVEEEKIEAAIAALSEEEPVEEPTAGEGEEPSTADETPVEEEMPAAEEPVVEPVPVENSQEEIPVDPEQEAAVPPVEEEVPPVDAPAEIPPMPELPPMVSLEEFNAVKADLEETKKALEGIQQSNQALLEALKSAGVVDGGSFSQLGEDNPSAPSRTMVDTTMDDVLREINRKPY